MSEPRREKFAWGNALSGITLGVVATANLVQGAWISALPLLDLTTIGLAFSVPLVLARMLDQSAFRNAALLLPILVILLLGYWSPPLSAYASTDRMSLPVLVGYVVVMAFFLGRTAGTLRWLGWTVVVMACVVGLAQVLNPDPVFAATDRITPTGLNPIGAGRVLGAGALCAFVLNSKDHLGSRGRWLLGGTTACLVVALLLTGSRGPVLATFLAGIVVWLLRRDGDSRILVSRWIGLATGFVVIYQLAGKNEHLTLGESSGRADLIEYVLEAALSHPLGVGWGNLYQYIPAGVTGTEGFGIYAHNILLEIWVEAGVLALVIFVLLVGYLGWSGVKVARVSPDVVIPMGLLTCSLIGAMFSSDIVGNRLLWVMIGVLLSVSVTARDRISVLRRANGTHK